MSCILPKGSFISSLGNEIGAPFLLSLIYIYLNFGLNKSIFITRSNSVFSLRNSPRDAANCGPFHTNGFRGRSKRRSLLIAKWVDWSSVLWSLSHKTASVDASIQHSIAVSCKQSNQWDADYCSSFCVIYLWDAAAGTAVPLARNGFRAAATAVPFAQNGSVGSEVRRLVSTPNNSL